MSVCGRFAEIEWTEFPVDFQAGCWICACRRGGLLDLFSAVTARMPDLPHSWSPPSSRPPVLFNSKTDAPCLHAQFPASTVPQVFVPPSATPFNLISTERW